MVVIRTEQQAWQVFQILAVVEGRIYADLHSQRPFFVVLYTLVRQRLRCSKRKSPTARQIVKVSFLLVWQRQLEPVRDQGQSRRVFRRAELKQLHQADF